jgi:hypothetical protein
MRSYLPLILTLIVLAGLAFCSACTSQPAANQTPQQNLSPVTDVGLVPVHVSQGSEFVSFDKAQGYLGDSESNSLNPNKVKTRILFIQGGGLDDAGNAQRWVFGINKGETNELRVYDHTGWTVIPFSGTLPSDEIVPAAVISPGRLFNENHEAIFEDILSAAPEQRDLDLRNGTYRITITSGSTSRILIFNATSGEAVEAND